MSGDTDHLHAGFGDMPRRSIDPVHQRVDDAPGISEFESQNHVGLADDAELLIAVREEGPGKFQPLFFAYFQQCLVMRRQAHAGEPAFIQVVELVEVALELLHLLDFESGLALEVGVEGLQFDRGFAVIGGRCEGAHTAKFYVLF